MATSSLLKAKGLHTFNNYLSAVPEGALLVADNVVIDKEGVIEPRRGITQYADTVDGRASQLIIYKDKLVVSKSNNKLAYESAPGVLTDYSGVTVPPTEAGLRVKSFESNGNLYLTTSSGIKKLSSASVLSSAVFSEAGGIKAITGTGRVNFSTPGFLSGYSKVGYRVTWSTKDANDNLIEGAPSPVIEVINQSNQSGTVDLTFQVPSTVTADYFYRVYRTSVFIAPNFAGLDQVAINDEMRLVIEDAYVSGTQITVSDVTPETFRDSGVSLYTNEFSGEGILQSNTPPPFAKDIALYKNFAMYANTKTKHTSLTTLLGTGKMISLGAIEDDVQISSSVLVSPGLVRFTTSKAHGIPVNTNLVIKWGSNTLTLPAIAVASTTIDISTASAPPTTDLTIFASSITVGGNSYSFVGRKQIFELSIDQANDEDRINYPQGSYIKINSADNETSYVIWFDRSAGVQSPPSNAQTEGAALIKVTLNPAGNTVQQVRDLILAAVVASSFDFELEEISTNKIRVFTSRSGFAAAPLLATPAPGLSATTLQIGYGEDISSRYVRLPKYLSPGLAIDDAVRSLVKVINNTSSSTVNAYYIFNPAGLPGQFQLEAKALADAEFTLRAFPVDFGNSFNPSIATPQTSSNEARANRLYYSKQFQPEAVPIVNYVDIGPKDKAILRVVALRDSLFIFKEEAIYRLSGDTPSNFFITIHDNSATLVAPDALAILNNQIMAFTTQGVVQVSETGLSIISRAIESTLLRVTAPSFTLTKSLAFAAAYEQDRAFFLWLPKLDSDTYATECFRFNTFTQTWTSWSVGAVSAIVNPATNLLFIGAGDANLVERERKDLSRTDYADRKYTMSIPLGSYSGTGNDFFIGNVSNVDVGDIFAQTQYLTISQITRLLRKLAIDPGMPAGSRSQFENYQVNISSELHTAMIDITNRINAALGTSYSNSFSASNAETLRANFNRLIGDLNLDSLLSLSYDLSTGSINYELTVSAIQVRQGVITVLHPSPIVAGPIVLHKAIKSDVIYAPLSFGDPATLKQVRMGTMLFANAALAFGSLAYSSDLSPNYEAIPFILEGEGSFGASVFGSSSWGGEGTQRPFRTIIPRQKQRCRFLRTRFQHSTAFFKYGIYGISFDFEVTNSRAYK